jgi:hypothetical protein
MNNSEPITGYDYRLEAIEQEWTEREGIGPCGHYAAYQRQEHGWPVAVCEVIVNGSIGPGFTHYVNIVASDIYDMSNPFQIEGVRYADVEMLDADEMPELVDAESLATFSAMLESGSAR